MQLIRATLILVLLAVGSFINLTVSNPVYTPRAPVATGPDIVSNWEWRSMATGQHAWWLAFYFPGASVENVAYLSPPDKPANSVLGIDFSSWRDDFLEIAVDKTAPPLDVSSLGIREDLLNLGKVFSRIDCRAPQMPARDTCFFFVAWDDRLLRSRAPTFIAVLTNVDEEAEFALVEANLLTHLLPIPLSEVSSARQSGG